MELGKQEMMRKEKEKIQQYQELAKKYNNEKDQFEKLKSNYYPKLRETAKYFNELKGNLGKIREDTELLPEMFREEAKQRK